MTSEQLFELIADVDDAKIKDAGNTLGNIMKPKRTKRFIFAACLCVVLCFCLFGVGTAVNGGGFFGKGDDFLLEVHRDDFDSELHPYAFKLLNGDKEIKKAYIMVNNEWFLSDELIDFSQILTTDNVYVLPLDGLAYSFFRYDDNGAITELGSAFPPEFAEAPFGFGGLTYKMIEEDLSGVKYDDYIIAYSQYLKTVFVWARSIGGDVIVTYPTRPDLLGLQVGKVYALEDIQRILAGVYNKSSIKGRTQ